MERIVRVSLLQLPAVVEGKSFAEKQKKNLRSILKMLKIAGERKSDLVLLGEYSNLHHRAGSENRKDYVADPVPGPWVRAVARMAGKYSMNVVVPIFGTWAGVLSSYAVIYDRKGNLLGCYRKAHPTADEQRVGIVAGDDLPVFRLDFGKIGIMTCMDIEYPEVAQVLMLKGADILLFPHVQGTWGELDWEVRYRSRAIDTGLYVVSACYGFREGEWMPGKMIGRTSVIGRDGLILADMGRSIGVLTYDLDLEKKRITQFFFNEKLDRTLGVKLSRRPELYGALIEPRKERVNVAQQPRRQK